MDIPYNKMGTVMDAYRMYQELNDMAWSLAEIVQAAKDERLVIVPEVPDIPEINVGEIKVPSGINSDVHPPGTYLA